MGHSAVRSAVPNEHSAGWSPPCKAQEQPALDPSEPPRPSADAFKEESRKYFRTVFDHERWASHRSTSRYARHMMGMPR